MESVLCNFRKIESFRWIMAWKYRTEVQLLDCSTVRAEKQKGTDVIAPFSIYEYSAWRNQHRSALKARETCKICFNYIMPRHFWEGSKLTGSFKQGVSRRCSMVTHCLAHFQFLWRALTIVSLHRPALLVTVSDLGYFALALHVSWRLKFDPVVSATHSSPSYLELPLLSCSISLRST